MPGTEISPFTHCLTWAVSVFLQQRFNLNIQMLISPGSSWNASGGFSLWIYARTQGLSQSTGVCPVPKQQVVTESWIGPLALFSVLPPGAAVEYGFCSVGRHCTCCRRVFSALDSLHLLQRGLDLRYKIPPLLASNHMLSHGSALPLYCGGAVWMGFLHHLHTVPGPLLPSGS